MRDKGRKKEGWRYNVGRIGREGRKVGSNQARSDEGREKRRQAERN